jgi:hypothetical protein
LQMFVKYRLQRVAQRNSTDVSVSPNKLLRYQLPVFCVARHRSVIVTGLLVVVTLLGFAVRFV